MANNNLKKLLIEEGITQAQLASESSICQGTINKICNARRTGAPTTKHNLLKALNKLSEKSFSYEEVFPNSKKY